MQRLSDINKQLKDTLMPVNFKGNLTPEEYQQMYDESINDNENFWRKHGQRIDWFKPYTKIKDCYFSGKDTHIKWYYDGTLNASYNCIDRHIKNGKSQKTALIWEGNDPKNSKHISYQELYDNVCRLSNGLKSIGVKKGDRVTIYMSMIPEIVYAMLATVRIGAVHSVIFGGFSADSIAKRLEACQSEYVITVDSSMRGPKKIDLKVTVDESLKHTTQKIKKCIVLRTTQDKIAWNKEIDVDYTQLTQGQSPQCEPLELSAEDPMFILYTSGSTGTPKGVLHTTGGYMVYASMTHAYSMDHKPDSDVYWCTADCGWITGHSYIVYGPLANCATTLVFEGVPNYPTPSRFWEVIDKHKVSVFYTAPTAIRALMKEGDIWVKQTSRKSLRVLATVGEPINPEAWKWYYEIVGESRCPIADTWWQTETGGIMITPLPGVTPMKPGSASKPFFGIKIALVDSKNNEILGEGEGDLCMSQSWPGQMRSLYGDHQRFNKTYFQQHEGYYSSGDGCRRDKDGYYWITGRTDDIIIVSGHNLGTAEIESALVAYQGVAEAAVVGYPHKIKGQGIYAFVTLKSGTIATPELEKKLINQIRTVIGALASPDFIQFAPGVPKTRSGKIMRRILRKIAANDFSELGDVSTLTDPSVVEDLIENRKNK